MTTTEIYEVVGVRMDALNLLYKLLKKSKKVREVLRKNKELEEY